MSDETMSTEINSLGDVLALPLDPPPKPLGSLGAYRYRMRQLRARLGMLEPTWQRYQSERIAKEKAAQDGK